MKGADALIASAVDSGIEVCFANPGTTEMPLVLALDAVPGIRGILCLHENAATGAADGYARMTGKPAMCLLHLGPGLANGLTNLHNAKRAGSPILAVIGEHATWHRSADPLLGSDIEALAATVSISVIRVSSAAGLAPAVHDAIARARHGTIATVIAPHDCQIAETFTPSQVPTAPVHRSFAESAVAATAKALKNGKSAILLGNTALSEQGQRLAARVALATGADLYCDTFFARMERGHGLPRVAKLPYFPDLALKITQSYQHVVLAGARRPVAFFGYPGLPSHLTTEAQTVLLASRDDDILGALEALATELKAPSEPDPAEAGTLPKMPKGALDPQSISTVVALLQPEGCILMDEALTVGIPYFEASRNAPRFSHLMLTGGAIGQGPGTATGAAIACPDRKVINFQSDGSGAYSVQAFWNQARDNLDVVTIIGSNRSYNILNVELQRAGVNSPGPITRSMAALDRPFLDWVRIGEGFGVPSVAVNTAEGLARELERAVAARGPRLIEAIMS